MESGTWDPESGTWNLGPGVGNRAPINPLLIQLVTAKRQVPGPGFPIPVSFFPFTDHARKHFGDFFSQFKKRTQVIFSNQA